MLRLPFSSGFHPFYGGSHAVFLAKLIVKTDPIPDSLIVLELVRKHDTPDLIESANFFISTISVGYSSLFKTENSALQKEELIHI